MFKHLLFPENVKKAKPIRPKFFCGILRELKCRIGYIRLYELYTGNNKKCSNE